jgi:hypothetical protein
MTPAETIAAAIEKLEQMVDFRFVRQASDDPGTLITVGGIWVGEMMHPQAAADVVTLHRTIDAQLKALRAAEWLLGQKSNPLAYTHAATAAIIELAEAILGESS